MKLKGKALLSLLIVLTLLVQLFTVSVSAAGESLTWTYEAVDMTGQPIADPNPELAYAVQLGWSVDELMYSGLSVNPPAGWAVQKAWIDAGDYNESVALPLSADPNGSSAVSVDREVFVQSYDAAGTPVFNTGALSSQGGAYTLHVRFAQLDPNAAVEIRDAYGSVIGSGAVVVPGALESDASRRFVGWRLSYPNGASVLLTQYGQTFVPYASATLDAAYAAVASIRPADLSANEGDSLYAVLAQAEVQQLSVPYEYSLRNVSVTSPDAPDPLQAGTYTLAVSASLVDYNGKPVDPNTAVLDTQYGTLTVAAAYVPPALTTVNVTLYDQSCTENSGYVLDGSSAAYAMDPYDPNVVVAPFAADAYGNRIDPATAAAGTYSLSADLWYDQGVYTVNLTGATLTVAAAPVHEHSPAEAVQENAVAATCTTGGSYDSVVYCSGCGAELSRTPVTTDPLGHSAADAVQENAVAATCEAGGSYDSVVYCSRCNTELSRTPVTTDPLGHDWGEWTVTTPATEQAEGVEMRVCSHDATHTETRAIERLAHTHTLTATAAVPATCTEGGTAAYWTCSGCQKLFSDEAGTQEISAPVTTDALGHDWGEWTVTTPATETAEGVETRVCSRDAAHTETRAIPKLTHTHSLVKTDEVPATCEQGGTAAYWTCSGCQKLFSDEAGTQEINAPVTTDALGHDWGEWTVTTPATETAEGVETRVCSRDAAHTETRAIPRTGHTHTAVKVNRVEPSYTAPGNIEYYSCSGCQKLFRDAACTQEIALADTVLPQLSVTQVTVTVADQSWIVGSGTTLDQTRYTVTGFPADVSCTVRLTAVGYTGAAGTYNITAEVSGYDAAKYSVSVVPGHLTVSNPKTYRFLNSTGGYNWAVGSTVGLTLTAEADFSLFRGVRVDSNTSQLPGTCYTASAGSTIIMLTPAYLSTLTVGTHSIILEFADGTAATTFTVSPASAAPTQLTIIGRNVSKAYDGLPYDMSSYGQNTQGITTSFHLAKNGQTVSQAIEPGTYDIYLDSLSYATRSANGYSFTIVDSNGQVVATNYNNTSVRIGTLTITGSNITNVTVTVNDQSWTYDGTAHVPNAAGYTVSGMPSGAALNVKLSVVDASGRTLSAVTDAGTYTIKAECTGYDVSRYNVTVVKTGTLTVSPYKLTLTAESASKNYDGRALYNNNVKATALLSGHSFRAGDGVKFSVYDSRGNLIQNGPVAVGTYTKKVTDVHIVNASNVEVTSNYSITRIDGTLTVNNSNGSPKTGDTNNLTLWVALLAVSALLILVVAALFLRRGRKGKGPAKKAAPKNDARPADKK